MISRKHKCIFVHYPKTGGETINLHLVKKNHPPLKHATISQFKLKYPKAFEEYFKFTFARNSWEQVLSFYCHLRKPLDPNHKYAGKRLHPHFACRVACQLSFSEYCQIIFNKNRRFEGGRWFNSHLDFITDEKGNLAVDFIGMTKTLQEDFNIICDKIGIPRTELPHKNKSKHKHYTEYYNDKTRKIVAEKYAKDIEYFRYQFGE